MLPLKDQTKKWDKGGFFITPPSRLTFKFLKKESDLDV